MKESGEFKGSGDAMERVLAGLRDAEAPVGMERRILEGLEERASTAQARSGWGRFVPTWVTMATGPVATKALVCGIALAGVLVMAFVIPGIRRLGHAPERSKIDVVPVESVRRTPAVDAANGAAASSGGSSVRSGTMTKVSEAGLVRAVDSDDSVAMREMQTASYPAPPMPLTEQERLLLRISHRVDPVEMAMLDPKLRALQDAEEKAEFQRFFGQSASKPAAGQSTTEQAPADATMEQAVPQPSPTDQAVPAQPAPEQVVPAQPAMDQATPEQATPDQPTQRPSAPEKSAPDQSSTQQPTTRPTRTGDRE
jgi:hypothetical protein